MGAGLEEVSIDSRYGELYNWQKVMGGGKGVRGGRGEEGRGEERIGNGW